MLDGQCSRSRCQSNPAGICWGGTGSGAFSAESFSVSSRSDCENYVSSMLSASSMGGRRLEDAGEPTRNESNSSHSHRALQSRGRGADSMRNRQSGSSTRDFLCACALIKCVLCCIAAWRRGAIDVFNAIRDCSHRRAQDADALTANEALHALHRLRGGETSLKQLDHDLDVVLPASQNTSRRALQSCQCGRCISQCRCGNADSSSACQSCCGGGGSSSGGGGGGGGGANSCRYAHDGECDDGSQGGTQYCSRGTDSADCSGSSGGSCPAHSSPNSNGGCSCDSGYSVNSDRSGCEASSGGACRYANDGECDDGSQGGTQYCARGTDAADCSGSGRSCPAHSSPSSSGGVRCTVLFIYLGVSIANLKRHPRCSAHATVVTTSTVRETPVKPAAAAQRTRPRVRVAVAPATVATASTATAVAAKPAPAEPVGTRTTASAMMEARAERSTAHAAPTQPTAVAAAPAGASSVQMRCVTV